MIDISGENVVLVGALLLFVAVMAGKVAYRFGAPALLLFLGVGMLFTTTNATPAMNSTAARNWDLRRFTTTPPGKAYIASQILFLSISFSLLIVCISFVNR